MDNFTYKYEDCLDLCMRSLRVSEHFCIWVTVKCHKLTKVRMVFVDEARSDTNYSVDFLYQISQDSDSNVPYSEIIEGANHMEKVRTRMVSSKK